MTESTGVVELNNDTQFMDALLVTAQENSPVGILVVGETGQIISLNQKFVDIWKIPSQIIESRSDEAALQAVLDKMADPESFIARVKYLYEHKTEKSHEEILLKDGRTLDRYSAPIFRFSQDNEYFGRTWYFFDITELRQTEMLLRLSEERLKLAAASGQVGIWELNLQTNELIWDDTLLALYGISREDFSGTYDAWSTRLHPEDRVAIEATLQDAINGIIAYEAEFRIIWPDGEVHYIKGHAHVIRDQAGNPVRMIGTNWDNWAHAQTRHQLQLMRTAINESKAAFFWTTTEGQVCYASDYACHNLGCSLEELMGMYVWDFAPDYSIEERSLVWAELKRKGSHTFETHLRRKDGTTFPVEITTNHIAINGEEHGFSFVQDITDRKQTERELKLSAMVYRAIGEAIMVADANNRIIAVNPAFSKLTGYTEQEAVGRFTNLLNSGRQNKDFFQDMWRTLEITGRWQGEIWNRRKNGEVYREWLAISTIYDDHGTVEQRVAMLSEITDQKLAEQNIWQHAYFDPLTGLPNRRMFYDRLEQEMKRAHRTSLPLALIFLDLDHFKVVNDTLGHDTGDTLLKEAAQRLRSCVRETDTVSRLGGDEFTVILSELDDPDTIERIAQDVLSKLSEPFQLGDEVAHISASIGITKYPEDATGIDELIKNADKAMYAAKNASRNCYSYFTSRHAGR